MRPVCVPCRRFYRCEKNEFNWEEGTYRIWTGDKWKCPGCHTEIIIGVPARPWAEHFQPDYDESVRVYKPQIRVNDC